MSKFLRKLTALVLVASLVGCSSTTKPKTEVGSLKAGTYTTTAKGHNNDMKFEVVISETGITEVKILEHAETEGIADLPLERLPQQIVDGQTIAVDTIAGATYTSKAIIEGVEKALVEAGADVEAFKVKKEEAKKEGQHIEKEADVIIIGGGGAGLAAAASATQNGASVILIEKMPKLGGNTILAGGGYNAVDPKRQEPLGIEDSLELHYNQTLEAGDNKGNPELVKTLVDGAYPGIEWLESMGMKFQDEVILITGSLHKRTHSSEQALGTDYIKVLETEVNKNGGEILLETAAEELILEDGVVTGVKAVAENGDTLTLNAKNGVILASGGFGANVEMREEANAINNAWPSLDEQIKTTNHPGATGEVITMAEKIGANVINLEDIQLLPLGDPVNGSLKGKLGKSPVDYIHVNKEGKRFVSEDARRDVLSYALIEQTDKTMFIIDDADTYPSLDTDTNFAVSVRDLVDTGKAFAADTIEELAEMIDVDPATLRKTIDDYNAMVDAGVDHEFGKKQFGNKIDKAPYYACPRVPTVHHTMGGVEINTNTEVINKDGNVIPGLYAAGEVTGGIHGTNRVGGNAFADIIVFGKIAGEQAAKNK